MQGVAASRERCSDHHDQPVSLEPDRGGQQANRLAAACLSAGVLHEERPLPCPIDFGPTEDGWAGLFSLDLSIEEPTPPCQDLGKARALRGQDALDWFTEPELAGLDHRDEVTGARMEVPVGRLVEVRLQAKAEEQPGPDQHDGHDPREDQGDPQPDRQTIQRVPFSLRR